MKTVFIIGPFIKDPEGNKKKFEAMALRLWQAGFFAFNPIANCYYMFGVVPEATFVAGNCEAIRKLRFNAAILLDGWEQSVGSKREIEAMREVGTPVFTTFEKLCEWRDLTERVEKEVGEV